MVQGSKKKSTSVYGSDLYVIPNLSKLRKGDISAEIFIRGLSDMHLWMTGFCVYVGFMLEIRFNILLFLFVLCTVGYFEYPTPAG